MTDKQAILKEIESKGNRANFAYDTDNYLQRRLYGYVNLYIQIVESLSYYHYTAARKNHYYQRQARILIKMNRLRQKHSYYTELPQ